jgi:hypothetical protein
VCGVQCFPNTVNLNNNQKEILWFCMAKHLFESSRALQRGSVPWEIIKEADSRGRAYLFSI